jgi:5-methylcytosine-specific restriction endonuclease McrA
MDNNKYIGYVGVSAEEALIAYKEKTGFNPTILLARPEVVIMNENIPILVRTDKSIAYGFLVSHTITPDELKRQDIKGDYELSDCPCDVDQEDDDELLLPFYYANNAKVDVGLYTKKKVVAAKPDKAVCPCCNVAISDYNKLGYWIGWKYGIKPSYWDRLRLHVFKRDGYRCQECGKYFQESDLRCHHIVAKESGGTDSARNLVTLCKDHHQDEHPEFPDYDNPQDGYLCSRGVV